MFVVFPPASLSPPSFFFPIQYVRNTKGEKGGWRLDGNGGEEEERERRELGHDSQTSQNSSGFFFSGNPVCVCVSSACNIEDSFPSRPTATDPFPPTCCWLLLHLFCRTGYFPLRRKMVWETVDAADREVPSHPPSSSPFPRALMHGGKEMAFSILPPPLSSSFLLPPKLSCHHRKMDPSPPSSFPSHPFARQLYFLLQKVCVNVKIQCI